MSLKIRKFYSLIFFLALWAGASSVFGQNRSPEPPNTPPPTKIQKPESPEKPTIYSPKISIQQRIGINANSGYDTSEKAIVVDPKINISLCVLGGNIRVNGWDRSEVRVFVSEGSPVGFKVLQKNRQTEKPVWIMVVGIDAKRNAASAEECISGGEIGSRRRRRREALERVGDSHEQIVRGGQGVGHRLS